MKDKDSLIKIYNISEKLFSNSNKAFSFEVSKKIGEKKEGKIIYSFFEALFLLERKDAEIIIKNKSILFEDAIKYFSKKDKNFIKNYLVFKELRKKGYVVKTGLKFGGEFRVYEQHNLSHAKWICYCIKDSKIDVSEFISKSRVAHSTAKKLLLAIVDLEEDVLFYEVDWKKI